MYLLQHIQQSRKLLNDIIEILKELQKSSYLFGDIRQTFKSMNKLLIDMPSKKHTRASKENSKYI